MVENYHIATGKFHGVIAAQTPIGSFESRTIARKAGPALAAGCTMGLLR
jgi:acyl-CoA reductase-like NAD-dependent aldehyde dehydrogenase